MSFVAVLDALEQGLPPNIVQVTIPEGLLARARWRRCVKRPRGQLHQGHPPQPGARPARLRGQGARRASRASCSRPPTSSRRASRVRKLVDEQLAAFKRNFEHGRPALRAAQEPDPVRRADHRLAGRARGGGGQGAADDRLGDLQPAQERHPARHRRHRALRDRQLDEAAARVRAAEPEPVQHAPAPGPAARADRQPGPRLDQGGRPAGQDRLPLLRGGRAAATAGTSSRRPTPSSSATWTRYNAAREKRGGKSPTEC